MPLYEIEHGLPLDQIQRDELAQAITHTHSRKFATPSLFVNVKFTDTSNQHNYIAGKEAEFHLDQRKINRITAYVRAGGTRTREDFDDLALRISEAWNQTVNGNQKVTKERELNRVFIMGAITAGYENGFLLPRRLIEPDMTIQAGDDAKWLELNAPKFEELARQGDQDFKEMVEEMRTR
ncbi:hypothetical protein BDV25DRAFT_137159 [Aspergillus avenaceus]|uniref:Tautomerase cis-CaaD-like domain-containing protein n=1 Tax=Aspergillus avenaceus TaxID=36643 RepID=A0A5N6U3T3_ASPAV|nr:hypothetical protein BDV25DRAFT_137159 [Aspergillus avenaceus]